MIRTKSSKKMVRPPLPQRQLEKAQTVSNLNDRANADRLQERIRAKV